MRERREDIPLLAQYFLQLFSAEMGCEPPALSLDAIDRLTEYDFPGNVRELKNTIERALIESGGVEIQLHHLNFAAAATSDSAVPAPAFAPTLELPSDLEQVVAQAELWAVRRAVEQSDGNISEAARLLGTNRNRIYRVLGEDESAGT